MHNKLYQVSALTNYDKIFAMPLQYLITNQSTYPDRLSLHVSFSGQMI